jgi:hypothetical protein
LTACDGPTGTGYLGYSARGAPGPGTTDDGTIAPTAAGGSMPFTPEISLPTLRNFYDQYRTTLWGPYGFADAFNLKANWWDLDVIGIDQGPIALMIENYRTGSVWTRSMAAAEIQRGLSSAGFTPVVSVPEGNERIPLHFALEQNYPNPFNPATVIQVTIAERRLTNISVYDVLGRQVATLMNEVQGPGTYRVAFDASGLASGVYLCRLTSGPFVATRKMTVVR